VTIKNPQAEATKLRKKYCRSHFPVPVELIAKSEGIRVESIPLDDELSGMSFIKDGVSVIVVNANHHPNRRRFTLAHELGHHVLHAEYLRNNVHVDKVILHRNSLSSDGTEEKEVTANNFAAELLMPASKLTSMDDVDINNDLEVQMLAKQLKVSAAALTYRLINLGKAK
jgi:Zn-dependent peptidase ImmA (M78 family)